MDLNALKIERQPKARRRRNPWPVRIALVAALAGVAAFAWPTVYDLYNRVSLPTVHTFRVVETSRAGAAAVRGAAANGYVVAARRAALSSDVPGRIVEMNVQEGSVVAKGFVVARLFADDYRAAWQRAEADLAAAGTDVERARASARVADAEVLEAESAVDVAEEQANEARAAEQFAELELARIERLAGTGIEGQSRLQAAQRDLRSARARTRSLAAAHRNAVRRLATARERAKLAALDVQAAEQRERAARATRDQAKATLDKTDVRAPFDGIVVLKDAEVGEVVSPNAQGGSNARGAICTMVDFDSLEVQANVPETTLGSVALGAPADVFLDAFPNDRYAGVVDRIWPTADRQKATVEVRIRLEQKDQRLRPEMGVRIVFRQGDQPAAPAEPEHRIVVPAEAIVRVDGKTGAFVLERDTVQFTEVTAARPKGGRVAIDAGLNPDQIIVLDPPSTLRNGDRVRIATKK